MTLNTKLVHCFLLLSASISLCSVNNLSHKPEANKLYTDPHPQNEEVIRRLYFLQGNVI